jgi:hypothetical protein
MESFDSICGDTLFPSYLYSFRPQVRPEDVIADVDTEREENPEGRVQTNLGGWQSRQFLGESGRPTLDSLLHEVKSFTTFVCQQLNSSLVCERADWWANVNAPGDQNVVHHHGRTDFICVYYAKCEDDSGEFRALRTDGFTYSTLASESTHLTQLALPLEVGRAYVVSGHLLHYVLPNLGTSNRYSLSYNLHLL